MNDPAPRLDPGALLQAALDGEPAAAPWQAPTLEQLAPLFPELVLHERIGQGGMAAVYRATQTRLDRPVALKVLRPDLATDPRFAERFLREARALAVLSDPHVLTIHDFGECSGFCWLVTEYVDGANLRELMRLGRLSPAEVLRIVPQVCAALHFAHTHGVVHRDIKPENVLVDRQGHVKLADFGLAKLVGDPRQTALTHSGVVFGTPHYMAPEQWHGSAGVDHRADIYALGVLLYELLTGRLPVGSYPLASQEPGVPPGVDRVVQRSLQHEPERRYQSARDVQQDLERQRAAAAAAPAAAAAAGATVAAPGSAAWLLVGSGVAWLGGAAGLVLWIASERSGSALGAAVAAKVEATRALVAQIQATVAAGAPWTGTVPKDLDVLVPAAMSPQAVVTFAALLAVLVAVLATTSAAAAWRRTRHIGTSRVENVLAGLLLALPWAGPIAAVFLRYAHWLEDPTGLEGGRGTLPFVALLVVVGAVAAGVWGLWRASARRLPGPPPPIGRRTRGVLLFGVMAVVALVVQIVLLHRRAPLPRTPPLPVPTAVERLVGASRLDVLDRLGPPLTITASPGTMFWGYRGLDGGERSDAVHFTGGVVTHGNHPGVLLVPEPVPARGVHTGMTLGEVLQQLGPARNTVAGASGSALEFPDGTSVQVSADGIVVHVSR